MKIIDETNTTERQNGRLGYNRNCRRRDIKNDRLRVGLLFRVRVHWAAILGVCVCVR